MNDQCRTRRPRLARLIGLAAMAVVFTGADAAPTPPAPVPAPERPHALVTNFTAPLPANASIKTSVQDADKRAGLFAAQLDYALDAQKRVAELAFADEAYAVSGPGEIRVWIKGDGSGNQLAITLRHADAQLDAKMVRRLSGHADLNLAPVTLDFNDWKEVTLDAKALPPGRVAWWSRVTVRGKAGDDAKLEGRVLLDDMRVYPVSAAPRLGVRSSLIGLAVRDFSTDIALAVDARNFGDKLVKLRARVSMIDRNQSVVADRDFTLDLPPGRASEQRLELKPDHLDTFLPPFKITGDILSPDQPDLSVRIDHTLVMGNAMVLFTDMGLAPSRWYTAGVGGPYDRASSNPNQWNNWNMGEFTRISPVTQVFSRVSRVGVPAEERAEANKATGVPPLLGHALKLDYTAGEGVVYRGAERYFPGDAYEAGVWVKGDGSGGTLYALFFDFTGFADFWAGGWKRIAHGERAVCKLDFTDWRYFPIPLPGNGVGKSATGRIDTLKGSTDELDYPLELSAFRVAAPKGDTAGAVLIGSVYVRTQAPATDTLSVHLSYDDAEQNWSPDRKASVLVHNGSRTKKRGIAGSWELLDRSKTQLAAGAFRGDANPGEALTQTIDLASVAAKVAPALGPLTLRVSAGDASDPSVAGSQAMSLAKPDSLYVHDDFEAERGYVPLKALGIARGPAPGEPTVFTSTEQAHSGKRSLAIPWDREANLKQYVSIDPPLLGVPTEVSVWVFGDGSGALFFPMVGDQTGVPHGLAAAKFNLFPLRTDGPTANAVRIDWTGWKQLKFSLPPIQPNWDQLVPRQRFLAGYPLGLHLCVTAETADAKLKSGTVFVDDVEVRTHASPDQRVSVSLVRDGPTNVTKPGSTLRLSVRNADAAAERAVRLTGGAYDWRGVLRAATPSSPIKIAPGKAVEVALAPALTQGALRLRVRMLDGDRVIDTLGQDIIVGDVAPLLAGDTLAAMRDEWKLRPAVKDLFTYVDEDWDWVESFPGATQFDTVRNRTGRVIQNNAQPWLLLGFSAYWASGVGFDSLKKGTFSRVTRHEGQGVDIFLIPQRLADWDNYVNDVMRNVGKEMSGFVLWDNPDGNSTIAMPPDQFAGFIASADKWRRAYCPDKPVVIGGMSRATAIPYLQGLAKAEALQKIDGVNLRLDVGRISPEDAEVPAYLRQLTSAMSVPGQPAKRVVVTDLDWAVEPEEDGLNGFTQAAYLVRSDLLLRPMGIRPELSIRNGDFDRAGTGITYRRQIEIPPLREKLMTFELKPAWWALARMRSLLDQLEPLKLDSLSDLAAGRTFAAVYKRKADNKAVAIVWRNDNAGFVSAGRGGVAVESAEDIFGAAVTGESGWYPVGAAPVVLTLSGAPEAAAAGIAMFNVRDGAEASWPQRVLAAFTPESGRANQYAAVGGEPAAMSGDDVAGARVEAKAMRFAKDAKETFRVAVPAGAGLVLRRTFFLDEKGFDATVAVEGKQVGAWNCRHAEPELKHGLRSAEFFIAPEAIAGKSEVTIEVTSASPSNTVAWTALEYRGGAFPLTAMGAIHAVQSVGHARPARNMIGSPLKIGQNGYAEGIGVFANSLLEYSLNGQFKKFRAKVGVDAATDGRGSVVFEVWLDGKKKWNSPLMSGLDPARDVEIDVTGATRMRLIVTDGGDGNRFDAADWCEPALER